MGIRVDFDFRSRFANTGNYGRAFRRSVNPIGNVIQSTRELLSGERVGPTVTREAWARVMLPEALENSVPWVLRVVAKRKDGKEALVAYYAHHPDGRTLVGASRTTRERDIERVEPEGTEVREGGVWIIELSAQLDIDVYQSAWAEVVIYGGLEARAAPVVQQTLRES